MPAARSARRPRARPRRPCPPPPGGAATAAAAPMAGSGCRRPPGRPRRAGRPPAAAQARGQRAQLRGVDDVVAEQDRARRALLAQRGADVAGHAASPRTAAPRAARPAGAATAGRRPRARRAPAPAVVGPAAAPRRRPARRPCHRRRQLPIAAPATKAASAASSSARRRRAAVARRGGRTHARPRRPRDARSPATAVAAGDGALRTCSARSVRAKTKSSISAPSRPSAWARTPAQAGSHVAVAQRGT